MYERGAQRIVRECLAVDADEQLLVLSDGHEPRLVKAVVDAGEAVGATVSRLDYPPPETHGAEPPDEVAAALRATDVFVAPTGRSLTHTDARREACAAGARGATLPGITPTVWDGALTADYDRVAEICRTVWEWLAGASRVSITTPSGTDLTLGIDPAHFEMDSGIYHDAGSFGNLPAGEVDGAVTSATGTIVADHCLQTPSGTVIDVDGNEMAAHTVPEDGESELVRAFESEPASRQLAELGIGTNPQASLVGNVLQDEKVLGTCHVAFGDNTSYVSTDDPVYNAAPIHYDLILEAPTVRIDGQVLLEEGTPQFPVE